MLSLLVASVLALSMLTKRRVGQVREEFCSVHHYGLYMKERDGLLEEGISHPLHEAGTV